VRSRIRALQQQLARRRMMQEVPKADVVVTNPTHYAVALRYDRDRDAAQRGAPRVVAKGVDAIALKIREIARDAGVIVYEEPPLARALHAQCEIGDEVPVELYQAVASVLAYVYRVRGIHAPA
jgi:flagellar biosynthetic protein FlhB